MACSSVAVQRSTVPHRDLGKEEHGRELGTEQTVFRFPRVLGREESLDLELVVGIWAPRRRLLDQPHVKRPAFKLGDF